MKIDSPVGKLNKKPKPWLSIDVSNKLLYYFIVAASSKPVTQKLPIDASSISVTFGYIALIILINIDIATLSVAGGTSICYTITSSHSYTTSTSC